MSKPSEPSERQRVLHAIGDGGSAIDHGKAMRVTPKFVRPFRLHIDELKGRIPLLYFRQPPKRNPSQAYGVSYRSAGLHLDGCGRENAELHPRRGEAFQVFRPGEKVKNLGQRPLNPSFTMEVIHSHCRIVLRISRAVAALITGRAGTFRACATIIKIAATRCGLRSREAVHPRREKRIQWNERWKRASDSAATLLGNWRRECKMW